MGKSRTNVASVGSVFNDTRKVKVLSLPETIKEKSTFRAKALRRELAVGIGENHVCFYTSTSRDKIKANQIDFIKSKAVAKELQKIGTQYFLNTFLETLPDKYKEINPCLLQTSLKEIK